MLPTLRNLTIFCFSLPAFACTGSGSDGIYTIDAARKDFRDIVILDGVAEPVQSTTFTCPCGADGTVIYIVEDGTVVQKGDTLCVIEDNNLVQDYENWITNLETTRAHIEKVVADLNLNFALLEAQVQTNQADTKMAERDSLELIYASPRERKIKELEIRKLAIEKSKLEQKLELLKVIDQTEVKRWEVEIAQLETNIRSREEKLESLIITAPNDGLALRAINRMTQKKVMEGDNVWSHIPLVVMPQMDGVKVKITAAERDFKYISVGDSVYYTFDAMPGNIAFGRITNKTPVGREHTQGSKVKFFDIEASVDSLLAVPEPGFTANCHVVVRELKDTVVVPLISVFEEDSLSVVYIKGKRGFERRQVLTGTYSSKETVVTAGLAGNERIAMEKPHRKLVRATVILPDSVLLAVEPQHEEHSAEPETDIPQTDNDDN